jgi:hypothetical protein
MSTNSHIDHNDHELIRKKGIEALIRELGTAGMVSFLQLYSLGQGDYTEERKAIHKDISLSDIKNRLKELRQLNGMESDTPNDDDKNI